MRKNRTSLPTLEAQTICQKRRLQVLSWVFFKSSLPGLRSVWSEVLASLLPAPLFFHRSPPRQPTQLSVFLWVVAQSFSSLHIAPARLKCIQNSLFIHSTHSSAVNLATYVVCLFVSPSVHVKDYSGLWISSSRALFCCFSTLYFAYPSLFQFVIFPSQCHLIVIFFRTSL